MPQSMEEMGKHIIKTAENCSEEETLLELSAFIGLNSFINPEKRLPVSQLQDILHEVFLKACEKDMKRVSGYIVATPSAGSLDDILAAAIRANSVKACEVALDAKRKCLSTSSSRKTIEKADLNAAARRFVSFDKKTGTPEIMLFSNVSSMGEFSRMFKFLCSKGLDMRPVSYNAADDGGFTFDTPVIRKISLHKLLKNAVYACHGNLFQKNAEESTEIFEVLAFAHFLIGYGKGKMPEAVMEEYLDEFIAQKENHRISPKIYGSFIGGLFAMGKDMRFSNRDTFLHRAAKISTTLCPATSFGDFAKMAPSNITAENQDGRTVLDLLAENNPNDERLRILESMGYSLAVCNSNGVPAMRSAIIHYALKDDVFSLIEYFRQDMESYKKSLTAVDKYGNNILLELVKRECKLDILNFIAADGADIAAKDVHGETCLRYIDMLPESRTNGYLRDVTKFVIESVKQGRRCGGQVDVFAQRGASEMPLYHRLLAMYGAEKEAAEEFVERLRELGVEPSLNPSPRYVRESIEKHNSLLLSMLVECGADVSSPHDGMTPMQALCRYRSTKPHEFRSDVENAMALHAHGANIDEKYPDVSTGVLRSFFFGVARDWVRYYEGNLLDDVPDMLLKAGASVFDRDLGVTVLGVLSHINNENMWAFQGRLSECPKFMAACVPYYAKEMEDASIRWTLIDTFAKECATLGKSGAITKPVSMVLEKIAKIANRYDRVAGATVTSSDFDDGFGSGFPER